MNDLASAQSAAGLLLTKMEYSQVCRLRQGPFGGQSYFWIMRKAAEEFFGDYDHSCFIFQMLFDELAMEAGMNSYHPYGSREHQDLVWRWCYRASTMHDSCANHKSGRWWSFEERSRQSAKHRWTDLLVLLYVGFRRGWWKSSSTSPLQTLEFDFPVDDQVELPDEPVAAEGEQPDPGRPGNDGEDGPATEYMSAARSREEARRRRQSCVSALHFASKLLSRRLSCSLWAAMVYFTIPAE